MLFAVCGKNTGTCKNDAAVKMLACIDETPDDVMSILKMG